MNIQPGLDLTPTVQGALEELATTISRHYPDASFRISRGEDDPAIVQLVTTVDIEDTDPVLDVVMDRLLELQDQDLPVFVVTERPIERTLAMREATRSRKRAPIPTVPG